MSRVLTWHLQAVVQHREEAGVGLRVPQLLVDQLKHLGGTLRVDVNLEGSGHSEGQSRTDSQGRDKGLGATISVLPAPSLSGKERPVPDYHPGTKSMEQGWREGSYRRVSPPQHPWHLGADKPLVRGEAFHVLKNVWCSP